MFFAWQESISVAKGDGTRMRELDLCLYPLGASFKLDG